MGETTKLIKFLALKGACLTIKDNEGKTPIDLAHEIKNPKIKNEALTLLGPPLTFDFLQLEPPRKLIYRSSVMPTLEISAFLL